MIFEATKLDGAWILVPERLVDARGSFARELCVRELEVHGLNSQIAQINVSVNDKAGTLRGMHYQRAPHGETKVVRVLSGAIFDVLVDLRPESPTFKQWLGMELSAAEGHSLYIPTGLAHGFQTLTDGVVVQYLMGSFHVPGAGAGVAHDDPAFGIAWPRDVTVISEADRTRPRIEP